jgi:hypothetical protein
MLVKELSKLRWNKVILIKDAVLSDRGDPIGCPVLTHSWTLSGYLGMSELKKKNKKKLINVAYMEDII